MALCACGGTAAEPEKAAVETPEAAVETPEAAAETPEAAEETSETAPGHEEGAAPDTASELPAEGTYTIFAVEVEGALIRSEDFEVASTLTLAADGTGSMSMNDDSMDITVWTLDGEAFSLTLADGSGAEGELQNGILKLDIYGTGYMLLYYAREGADVSAYAPMTMEEYRAKANAVPDSMLYALWSSFDTSAGVHLRYNMHTDYMDANQRYDVHGKNGVYYSSRTTLVSGYENTLVTFFRDGTAYNLDPEKMTGVVVTTTTSSYIMDNIMLMDELFSDIQSYAKRTDYTVETREVDGVSCTAEVFPATAAEPEAAFCFGEDGRLLYAFKGAPVIDVGVEIGETAYTVIAIDAAVDEALFDISGYQLG